MTKQVLIRSYLLTWIFLALAIISKSLGLYSFVINTETKWFIDLCYIIDNNSVLYNLVSFIFSFVTVNLLYACMVDDYKSKYKRMMLYAIPLIIAKNMFILNDMRELFYLINVVTFLVPLKFKGKKFRICGVIVLDIIFQVISSIFIREIDYMTIMSNTVVLSIFMIDYYIMLVLLLINIKMKGVLSWYLDFGYWVKIVQNLKLKRENSKKTQLKTLKLLELLTKSYKKLTNYYDNNWIDLDFFIKYSVIHPIIVLLPLILYTLFVQRTYEFILFMIAYVWLRNGFKKTFHADHIPGIKTQHITATCTMLSVFLFMIVINHLLPSYKTLLSGILIALIFDYGLFLVKDYIDLWLFKRKITKFDINTCTKDELIIRCKINGLSDEEIKLAIMMFYDKMKASDIAVALCIENQSVYNKKLRLKKKIESIK